MTGNMNVSNGEEFLLKWNNHQSNLISVFKDWLRDESFVDVSLVCEGEIVSGHKVVLAACSPLLNKILHNNPCRHPIVILNDVPFADMKALLKFIYQGEVSVSQNELASFLRTADNLQIKGLAEDKEKDDKRKKEKDFDNGSKKRQKTDYKNYVTQQSSQLGMCLNVMTQNSFSTSPKPRKLININERQGSVVLNFQKNSCDAFSNSLESLNCSLSNDNSTQSEDLQFEQNSSNIDNRLILQSLIVKKEPVDCIGDMTWHNSNSTLKRIDTGQEDNQPFLDPDACSSNIENSDFPIPSLTYSDKLESEQNETNDSQLEDEDKNSYTIVEDTRKNIHGASDEQQHEILLTGIVEDVGEDEQIGLGMGSPGKFRGGRKPCCFCGKTFCDNYTLRRHMVTHLSRQRQFECTLCSAAYSRKDHLMAHMRRKHPLVDFDIDIIATKQS